MIIGLIDVYEIHGMNSVIHSVNLLSPKRNQIKLFKLQTIEFLVVMWTVYMTLQHLQDATR